VGFVNQALSLEEEIEVAELLSQSGPRTLIFARGVFAAAATSPQILDPTEWLPLVLGDQIPDAATLKRILALLIRDSNHVATELAEGSAPTPTSTDEDVVQQFCRGYVQVAQKNGRWTSNQAAFQLTLPLMVLSGYVKTDSLRDLKPEALKSPDDYRQQCTSALGTTVLELYRFFADARAERKKAQATIESGKVGRNDPCPCGSGKKFKKCCG
jgi:uncharacterized protein